MENSNIHNTIDPQSLDHLNDPIVNDRIGDPAYADGSSAAPRATAEQGARTA